MRRNSFVIFISTPALGFILDSLTGGDTGKGETTRLVPQCQDLHYETEIKRPIRKTEQDY